MRLFIEQMDRFLSQRHNVTPVALVDTMAESEKMDHYCDDSSDDYQSLGMQQESKSSLLNHVKIQAPLHLHFPSHLAMFNNGPI